MVKTKGGDIMRDYYQKSIKALQLAGMSERTQQCQTRAVRQLVDFYNRPPNDYGIFHKLFSTHNVLLT